VIFQPAAALDCSAAAGFSLFNGGFERAELGKQPFNRYGFDGWVNGFV
jgi:hypothetical protein